MGKTAIAEMLALAQMTDGWEAHECSSPDQLWRVFDASRRQVFVADDAFGSTEYRPEAAERWAQSLGRLLAMLDQDHSLIWTSRPAPLKAGLRRVQRERHSERFPAPGQVLVDASDLDLAEKTLILFRHAKARGASSVARGLVRSNALSIVEHPHFTPERIRRFVTDRLEALPQIALEDGLERVREELGRELGSPTEPMRTSFRALETEHRELLIALLDAPAGLIDERELAATVRRHHAGGLSRPPSELIDRLTDHFLRVTPLGIGWVHPSWRDLVINELREDTDARRRFMEACGLHGAMLALSTEGGVGGERALPLLVSDGDWDRLGDCLALLADQLEDQDLAQLLLALRGVRTADVSPSQKREARNLTANVLTAVAKRWDLRHQPLPGFLLEHWYALREWASGTIKPPQLGPTWAELYPASLPAEGLDRSELARADEWLALAQTLHRYAPNTLTAFGFFAHDQTLLEHLAEALQQTTNEDTRALAESILTRIQELAPGRAYMAARSALTTIEYQSSDQRWWTPQDIPTPPSSDPISNRTDRIHPRRRRARTHRPLPHLPSRWGCSSLPGRHSRVRSAFGDWDSGLRVGSGALESASTAAGSFLNILTLTTAGSCHQAPRGPGSRLPVSTHQTNAEITNGLVSRPARTTDPRRISTGIRGVRSSSRSAMPQAYLITCRFRSRTTTNLRLLPALAGVRGLWLSGELAALLPCARRRP